MNLRKSICEVIDMITDSVAQRLTDQEKKSKTKMWHIGLNDISDEQIWKGLEKFAKQPEKFFPTPGQFRELCISDGSLTSIEDEASLAWNQAFTNHNRYASPVFKNSIIAETIRQMGGWINFRDHPVKDEPFRKIEFISIYTAMKKRGIEFPPQLAGEFEQKIHIGFENQEEIDVVEKALLIESETANKIARL